MLRRVESICLNYCFQKVRSSGCFEKRIIRDRSVCSATFAKKIDESAIFVKASISSKAVGIFSLR